MTKRIVSIMTLALIVLSLSMFTLKVQPVKAIVGDLNGDGHVNMQDVIIAAQAFGANSSNARWNAEADLNGDGKIGIADLCIIAKNFS
jgi:uncharacterized protein (DUF2141 family)